VQGVYRRDQPVASQPKIKHMETFSVRRCAKHDFLSIELEGPVSTYGDGSVGCVWREMASWVYDSFVFLESDE